MRINRETLLKIAQDTVSVRTRTNREIQSAYLCGSLLGEEYLLGGTADIDLVFVHIGTVEAEREIVRLTDDFHLDIAHHEEKDYRHARSLRGHPWLGPTIAGCKTLYDPHHFMDFTQASVRGQFYQSEHVLERARPQAEHARQIWSSFAAGVPSIGPGEINLYLRAVEHAANAIASLSGDPLTERRFLINFPSRAQAAGAPGLAPGLLGLIGGPRVDGQVIKDWLPSWREAIHALPPPVPADMGPARIPYYQKAFDALLKGEQPLAALWPLLGTWTKAAAHLPEGSPELLGYLTACGQLGLQGQDFEERVAALDAFLDLIEDTLDRWGRQNGAG